MASKNGEPLPSILDKDIRRPSAWDSISLEPQITTPAQRLAGLVNTVKNGSQSLTVLVMDPRHDVWEDYPSIYRRINQETGILVTKDASTVREGLIRTLEPVGSVARSTLDDREWNLTDFGRAVKPAVLFAWRRMLQLGLDGTQIFASQSNGRRDETGSLITSAPMVRTVIMMLTSERREVQLADFNNPTNSTETAIQDHVNALANVKILTKDSTSGEKDSVVVEFELTEKGRTSSDWGINLRHSRGKRSHSIYVKEAIDELTKKGQKLTYQNIKDIVDEKHPSPNPEAHKIATVLGRVLKFEKGGYLQDVSFDRYKKSDVELTEIGKEVVSKLLKPLYSWAINPNSIPEIVDLANGLHSDPTQFRNIYAQIAESYRANSPYINNPRKSKINDALALIVAKAGTVTRADIAKLLNTSEQTASKIVRDLISSNAVTEITPESGRKIFLQPTS